MRKCDCLEAFRRNTATIESAVMPRTIRLSRAKPRVSIKEVEDAEPNEYNKADKPYTTVNQMVEKEVAKYSFAHKYENKARRETFTALCRRN